MDERGRRASSIGVPSGLRIFLVVSFSSNFGRWISVQAEFVWGGLHILRQTWLLVIYTAARSSSSPTVIVRQ